MVLSKLAILLIYLTSFLIYCVEEYQVHGNCLEYNSIEEYYDGKYGYMRNRTVYVKLICASVNLTDGPLIIPTNDNCRSCPKMLIIYSTIPSIPPSSFIYCTSITVLDIRNNSVKHILPGAFNLLTSLKELYLLDNNIAHISDGVFNSLIELRLLDLSQNQIQQISQHTFTGVMKLEILNLSSNSLQNIDSYSLNYLKKLTELDLSFNNLDTFNFTLIADKIQNLNVSNNRIRNIFGCFGVLTRLNLSHNLLTTLENNTCEESNSRIVELDLSHNSLSNVRTISTLHNLQILSLQNNNINFISNGFFSKLNNLIFLNLSSNELDQFQYGLFDGLSSLEILDVSSNQITDFKKYNYHLLKKLHQLCIHDNQIINFDSKELTEVLTNLEVVSLYGNNFACGRLVEIFHDLRTIKVSRGNSFNSSNIHGIACSESDYSSDLSPDQNYDGNATVVDTMRAKLIRLFNSDFIKSSMYNYFNRDFKKSNFFKYLENLRLLGNLSVNSFENNFENIKNIQKNQENFNKSITSYFNNDFKNSNFVKYLDNLKSSENFLNSGFTKSVMYNYFNKDFANSKFYKYLEALKKPQFAIKYLENSNDTKVEKLISTFEDEEENNENSALLIIIIVLLVIISFIMLCFMYATYTKFEKLVNLKNEQVELLDV